MSHLPIDKLNFADPNYDAFARIRTSHARTIFESLAYYGEVDATYEPAELTGGGTATHLPDESVWALTCGTAAGDKVSTQSHGYLHYHPGKSQLTTMVGIFEPALNVDARIGQFDDGNGAFFEMAGTAIGVVVRTSVSSSAVNNRVEQANWNLDTLDGNGPSAITLDPSKVQIFMMDFQWPGRVRFGFNIGGSIHYCHEVLTANVLDTVYSTTIELPLKYEIENLDVTGTPTTLKQVCSSVMSEAGDLHRGTPRTWSPGVDSLTVPVTTPAPMVSFEMQNPYNGKFNKSEAILTDVQTIAATDARPVKITFIKNGTLTGPTEWLPWENTVMNYDVTSTGITGGTALYSVLMSGKNAAAITSNEDVKLHAGDIITVTAVALSAAVDVWGVLNWRMVL